MPVLKRVDEVQVAFIQLEESAVWASVIMTTSIIISLIVGIDLLSTRIYFVGFIIITILNFIRTRINYRKRKQSKEYIMMKLNTGQVISKEEYDKL